MFRAAFYDGGMVEHEHNRPVETGVIDTAIVGGGVAGLNAALFLARAGRSTTVYDVGRSRIFAVERVREYMGFDGWTPGQMLARAREEALHYGASIRHATVLRR